MKHTLVGSLILLTVASGIAFTAFISSAAKSTEVMNILFIGFAGAIVAIQLAPSYLMLRRILGNWINFSEREFNQDLKSRP